MQNATQIVAALLLGGMLLGCASRADKYAFYRPGQSDDQATPQVSSSSPPTRAEEPSCPVPCGASQEFSSPRVDGPTATMANSGFMPVLANTTPFRVNETTVARPAQPSIECAPPTRAGGPSITITNCEITPSSSLFRFDGAPGYKLVEMKPASAGSPPLYTYAAPGQPTITVDKPLEFTGNTANYAAVQPAGSFQALPTMAPNGVADTPALPYADPHGAAPPR